ncbi:MAG: hypothetical protein HYV38_01280 [Candidatus Levybacteria bacterium]|nr:hypothetical protein [Candidatus Levybacteria bacterium]
MLSTPGEPLLPPPEATAEQPHEIGKNVFLISDLSQILPKDEVRELSPEEEKNIEEILKRDLGITAKAEIDGKRLNRSYGYIGAEQHLARYPGDTMATHFETQDEANLYYSSGMAPGLGAWRYFTNENGEFSEKGKQMEKYYIAVQTFLAPYYNLKLAEYRDFFKFRKMLLVNPHNGRAIVTVIGDSGPAVWTGKHLGGSPEVMKYLEIVDGRAKGPVLYFFIDDPEDKIPLGPVNNVI